MTSADQNWQQLQQILNSHHHDNTFTAIECHGLLCAAVISPSEVPAEELCEIIFDQENAVACKESHDLQTVINQLIQAIESSLEKGEKITPPCSLDIPSNADATPLNSWAAAFMQIVFSRENDWFDKDEELMAQMSLPILLASDLVQSDEFTNIKNNGTLFKSLCAEIPNSMTDMYLFFRLP